MSERLLEVTDLMVNYGAVSAVRNVSMHVGRGEIVALIGSNGAGKSSTLKAIMGLVRPGAGEIRFRDQETQSLPAYKKVAQGLCLIPEGRRIFVDQTVEDNLLLGAYVNRHRGKQLLQEGREKVYALFPRLAERAGQTAGSLSGGEQQMLAIGRGLLSDPEVLMIDELSLGLAPQIVDQLLTVLQQLNQDGLTVLLVEQLAAQALSIADRAYVMGNGAIQISGPAQTLLHDPDVIANFLGH